MMVNFSYKIRPATPSDESFLWEMLYQSLYIEAGSTPYPREILNNPQLARYVIGWGRTGDIGFIAIDLNNKAQIGAVWSRLASSGDRGFAYVDEQTPELGIAVLRDYRGQGVGTALLKRHLEEAEKLYAAISLSVSPNNPAKQLYERQGFKTVDVRDGHPIMKIRFAR
jgi:ribosomal protein S18 acetylase RimI-like enzyme